jgi:hypothetical protein
MFTHRAFQLAMARVALSLTLITAVGFSASSVFAQTVPPQNTVTTQGHGEVKVRPDSLSVSVSVESKNANLASARDENNRKMQSIVNALKGLNIPNMKLETQSINVYPIQGEYQKGKLPKTIGYQVTNNMNVTITGASADMLGDYGSRIVDTALNAGANNVGGLNFFLTEVVGPRTHALELAVQDARHNADAMAKAANITLTGVYSMEGSPQFNNYPRPMPMFAMKAEAAAAPDMAQTPVETGETTITSDVTVRYKF